MVVLPKAFLAAVFRQWHVGGLKLDKELNHSSTLGSWEAAACNMLILLSAFKHGSATSSMTRAMEAKILVRARYSSMTKTIHHPVFNS
jgi:hypothetical protein